MFGWTCPHCKLVHNPTVLSCNCQVRYTPYPNYTYVGTPMNFKDLVVGTSATKVE